MANIIFNSFSEFLPCKKKKIVKNVYFLKHSIENFPLILFLYLMAYIPHAAYFIYTLNKIGKITLAILLLSLYGAQISFSAV